MRFDPVGITALRNAMMFAVFMSHLRHEFCVQFFFSSFASLRLEKPHQRRASDDERDSAVLPQSDPALCGAQPAEVLESDACGDLPRKEKNHEKPHAE